MKARTLIFFTVLLMGVTAENAVIGAEPGPRWPLWTGEPIADYARHIQQPLKKNLKLNDRVALEFVLIPAGKFTMGTCEPNPPIVSTESMRELLVLGALSMLALIAWFFWKRTQRRFSFSLRWFILFVVACGVVVGSFARWRLAIELKQKYELELQEIRELPEDEVAHPVTISRPFYMSRFAITQEQYDAILANNPSSVIAPQLPVQNISWNDAYAFTSALNENLKRKGLNFPTAQLPTEAQWEFACRAGSVTRFYNGNEEQDLNAIAWYEKNSANRLHSVGEREPNKFGLYDMHGNIWQWCQDAYTEHLENLPSIDPVGEDGEYRVLRGGSWDSRATTCRSTCRARDYPSRRNVRAGFRVVLPISVQPEK